MKSYPNQRLLMVSLAVVIGLMAAAITWLLSVEDPVVRKQLIEDSGPVQLIGQTAIALAFASSLFFAVFDKMRRSSYLFLSYLLMFYTLREADYHYKVSEYAKATQFKRFFSHELIPISTKLFLATIVILFLVVLFRYLRQHKATFLEALKSRLPWAVFAASWGCVFVLSQVVDQIPLFHNITGQIFEEVFESSAEMLALVAVILFRTQLLGASHEPLEVRR